MSKEAMLTAEVAVLTELVRVLSDKVNELEAKQEQGEPVAWFGFNDRGEIRKTLTKTMRKRFPNYPIDDMTPVYITPQQRTWVGLTVEEREQIQQECFGKVPHHVAFAHAIEAKLKEKNT